MTKLLLKLGLLALIAALIGAHEIFLPKDQYTFRVWEALALRGQPKSNKLPPGEFYPNQHIERREVGDIAAYSPHQIVKQVIWDTDAYGFRNRPSHCKDYPIVVAGDSFGIGTSLTQADILSEQIAARTGQCVYNLSSEVSPRTFLLLRQLGLRPKVMVVVVNERGFYKLEDIPESFKGAVPPPVSVGFWTPFWILADRLAKPTYIQYRARHGTLNALRRPFIHAGDDLQDGSDPKMMFYFGAKRDFTMSDAEIDRVARVLVGYQRDLRALGTELIFVPVNDKETIYPEKIPKAPQAITDLERVYRKLATTSVKYVDLYHPYRKRFLERGDIFYQLDDTHWNARGVSLAADLIVKELPK